MRRIFWDTMLFAYWLEGNQKQQARVQHIHEIMLAQGDELCSSLFVMSELLVGPVKLGDGEGTAAIEDFFSSSEITLLPYTLESARAFAQLRKDGIKPLDAIHLATAAATGVDLFLTNDRRLHSARVPGIKFIASLDTDLF